MRIVQSGLLSLLLLSSILPAAAQDSPSSAVSPVVQAAPAPAVPAAAAPNASAPAPQPSSSVPAPSVTTAPAAPATLAPTQITPAISTAAPAANFNEVIDRMVQREHFFLAQMRHMRPMVETYLQYLKDDSSGNSTPLKDQYFLGRLDMSEGPEDTSFMGQPGFGRRMMNHLTGVYSMHFLPLGFAQMVVLDNDFQKRYYDFAFVRRAFLGDLRCLVIDVQPKHNAPAGRFLGRIWVEDQDYNIVRFNGTYYPQPKMGAYLHFDSWRLNMRAGTWLPAYIYTEESHFHSGLAKSSHFKSQTRLWGYDLKGLGKNEEFTQILIDSQSSVKDQSDTATDASPVMAERMWEKQAEENAVERMQKIGLLAPSGELDKVLLTVVNNLLLTNNIDLQGDVRCRVLLTAPLESFTIGRTIVVSRGLLDVLPDEASLAMVLAHEVSHILLGHKLDTTMAFNDRMFFPDSESFQRLDFKRNPADEEAADTKALELLKNSPYKDKLGNAGLFLKALQQRGPDLPSLIRAHLGNGMAGAKSLRLSALVESAPALDEKKLDQIAALPLGGRIKVDPWTDQVELSKSKLVPLTSAREKMPFEITPFFPYLTRLSIGGPEKVALTEQVPAQK